MWTRVNWTSEISCEMIIFAVSYRKRESRSSQEGKHHMKNCLFLRLPLSSYHRLIWSFCWSRWFARYFCTSSSARDTYKECTKNVQGKMPTRKKETNLCWGSSVLRLNLYVFSWRLNDSEDFISLVILFRSLALMKHTDLDQRSCLSLCASVHVDQRRVQWGEDKIRHTKYKELCETRMASSSNEAIIQRRKQIE